MTYLRVKCPHCGNDHDVDTTNVLGVVKYDPEITLSEGDEAVYPPEKNPGGINND